jgi:hypothetical protein
VTERAAMLATLIRSLLAGDFFNLETVLVASAFYVLFFIKLLGQGRRSERYSAGRA